MSDRGLREHERRWRAGGAEDDEVALLRARLQAGALTPERLELAAWLGQPASRLALGEAAPAGERPRLRWVSTLQEEQAQQALAAGARRALDAHAWLQGAEAPLLSALDAWSRTPGAAESREVDRVTTRLVRSRDLEAPLDVALALLDQGPDNRVGAILLGLRALVGPFPVPGAIALLRSLPRRSEVLEPFLGWVLGAGHGNVRPLQAEDEASWLRTRLRAGAIPEARLELAAWAGHEPARLALQADPAPDEPILWIEGLRRFREVRDQGLLRDLLGRTVVAAVPWGDVSRAAADAGLDVREVRAPLRRAADAALGLRARRSCHRLGEEASELEAWAPHLESLRAVARAMRALEADIDEIVACLTDLLPHAGRELLVRARAHICYEPIEPADCVG